MSKKKDINPSVYYSEPECEECKVKDEVKNKIYDVIVNTPLLNCRTSASLNASINCTKKQNEVFHIDDEKLLMK